MHVTTRDSNVVTSPDPGSGLPRAGARILLAEHDDDVRSLITVVLERNGHRVDVATDGQQAWELVQHNTYEVLVLDVELTRLSGPELVANVRAHPSAGSSRVLMLSAVAGRREQLRARSQGADDYLPKPFRVGELSERVRSLIALGPVGPVDHPVEPLRQSEQS